MRLRPRASISVTIAIAFGLMSLLTGGVTVYTLFVAAAARDFVTNTYDGALMGVSYARAASLDFVRMENELLRRQTLTPGGRAESDGRLQQLAQSFKEDIVVAEERSTSAKDRAVIADIRTLSDRWTQLEEGGAAEAARQAVAERMVERLDMLIELTADSSFIARHRATTQMAIFTHTSLAAAVFALVLAAAITVVLRRRIIHPLRAAAGVANRISAGELQTPIPIGGADETGTLLRSMTVMQENIRVMVERERAQRRSAQNRLIEALETSREGIILVDESHQIVIANSRLSVFFPTLADQLKPDIGFDEAFGRLAELMATEDEEEDDEYPDEPTAFARELLSPGSEFRLADGRWLRVSCSNTQEGGFFLVISDFTEIKEREAHLNDARRLAEAASEAKGRFLANMSHELRTPLNAIIGFAEILTGEFFGSLGNPRYREYATDIHKSGVHLLAVINNVLDLTKSEAGKLTLAAEAVDLVEVVNDCTNIMRDQCARAQLGFTARVPDEALVIFADAAKVRQILLNLMSNAIKFTEPGGSVLVNVEATTEGAAALTVADTGIGMSPDDIPIALAPFGQVDSRLARRYEGTGLGLPLTKALVELHGGALRIESEAGRGTTVMVTLRKDPPALSGSIVADLAA